MALRFSAARLVKGISRLLMNGSNSKGSLGNWPPVSVSEGMGPGSAEKPAPDPSSIRATQAPVMNSVFRNRPGLRVRCGPFKAKPSVLHLDRGARSRSRASRTMTRSEFCPIILR